MEEVKQKKTKKKRKKQTDRTVHVGFPEVEYKRLSEQASEADVHLGPFVRELALKGKVTIKKYDIEALNKHSTELGNLVQEVRRLFDAPHPDRWKYEADIAIIEKKLDELLREEKHLVETMMRRLKR